MTYSFLDINRESYIFWSKIGSYLVSNSGFSLNLVKGQD